MYNTYRYLHTYCNKTVTGLHTVRVFIHETNYSHFGWCFYLSNAQIRGRLRIFAYMGDFGMCDGGNICHFFCQFYASVRARARS